MDNAEFERLLADCENALKRFVYYKTPSKEDGDDVLQETRLAAYRSRAAVRNADSFKAWLLRIAANKCRDFYRERARRLEIPLDDAPEGVLTQSLHGLTVTLSVRETLENLPPGDARILDMFLLQGMTQAEIARALGIPEGTVKSRVHTAKSRFRSAYQRSPAEMPHKKIPPDLAPSAREEASPLAMKGESTMGKLPEILPAYTIAKSDKPTFPVKWEEIMGWFIVPRLHEKLSWAMYDFPKGSTGADRENMTRTEVYDSEVTGRAAVHGIEGVEIAVREVRGGEHEGTPESRDVNRTFVAQLTDTHCRILSESHMDDGVKRIFTFLDGDDFIPNWGFGEDNCGNEVNLAPKGIVRRDGNDITTAKGEKFLLDVVGRYDVAIGGKTYDTVCVIDVNCYNDGVVSEQFLDQNGRTVLWRRFNRDDWHAERYGGRWSERLPDSERLTVDGETYVHWYDCVTDYIFGD